MKTNFYVDAFNLYYGSLKGTPDRWLDLDALFRAVFPKNEINRIRYFTAIVESRPSDLRRPAHQRAYLRALQTIPSLSVHYGQYKTRAVRLPLAKPPASSVGVLNPHPLKRRSFDLQPTFFKQMRRGPIAASQFPRVLKDAQGKIRKPPSW